MDADALDAARRQLYRLEPDAFTSARSQLALGAGDAALAAAIGALRKPTLAAWIVNSHVAAHPADVARLVDIGDRLRQAQGRLPAAELRTLSIERRHVVADVSRAAVTGCGRATVSQAVRDEVTSTFDAAVADPDIAARLGVLVRSESWSGFGTVAGDTPALTLVTTDRDTPTARRTAGATKAERAATEARREKLSAARQEFDDADAVLTGAHEAEQELAQRIRRLTTRLTTLQRELEQARHAQADAKKTTSAARRARRAAQSALDRAERQSPN